MTAADSARMIEHLSKSRRDVAALAALVIVLALSAHYLWSAKSAIEARAADPEAARTFVASDSAHYLEIARALAAGDLSMRHVGPTGGPDLGHRQPLYPAMLAAAMRLGLDTPAALAMLDAALVVASMWMAYAIGIAAYGSRVSAVAGALIVWRVPYLYESVTSRLLTEAGYVLIVLCLGLAFLRYRESGAAKWLYAAAVAGALAYLQRINGLLTAALALVCLAASDLAGRRAPHARDERTRWTRHAIAVLLFVLATIPSWLPRTLHAGNPLYHGYLANYLWVDDYKRAHVPGPPRYSWRDYAREHDAAAAAARLRYGLRRVFYDAPREKYGRDVAAAMLVGLVVVILRRDMATLSWLGVGVLSTLPLAWTALSNPVRRIPATALLPFGVVIVCAGAAIAARELAARSMLADAGDQARESS